MFGYGCLLPRHSVGLCFFFASADLTIASIVYNMYTHTHTAYIHTTHTCMHAHIHACMHIHTYNNTHLMHAYTHMHPCTYTYTYTHAYKYIHACIHMHTHTHTYPQPYCLSKLKVNHLHERKKEGKREKRKSV